MKIRTILRSALALVLTSALTPCAAQDQSGVLQSVTAIGGIYPLSFAVVGNVNPVCPGPFNYTLSDINAPWGSNYGGVETYFNLPMGSGNQSFSVRFGYSDGLGSPIPPDYLVYVDGQYCPSCSAVVTSHQSTGGNSWLDGITITHQADNAWLNDGEHEFGLRVNTLFGPEGDLRFKAIMVGVDISDLLGYFNGPELPLVILRDPPGDLSYSSLSTSQSFCSGTSWSATTDQSNNYWEKAKVGVSFSVSFFFVSTDVEAFAEAGTYTTVGTSQTAEGEYQTCIETTTVYTTSPNGAPDDEFIGSSLRYAYGVGVLLERPTPGTLVKDAGFVMEPVSLIGTYRWSESHIRTVTIPALQSLVASLTPGTALYKQKLNQLNVWNRTLAMNDAIKADAAFVEQRNFSGNGATTDFTLTRTTSSNYSIEWSAFLENGLSEEYGAYIGGSGVSSGGEMRMRKEYGNGLTSSNTSTNTMSYSLGDEEGSNSFSVDVYGDKVFGTYAFRLDSTVSATSCPYEGGYQLEQPQLWVGAMGQSHMDQEEVPIGGTATFPIYICNNSNVAQTYYMKFESGSNGNSATLNAYGTQLTGASNQSGIELPVGPNTCLPVGSLFLDQLNQNLVDYENINVYLYSYCEPELRSVITISAYFGAGNVNEGNYCTPTSEFGTTAGDWIDGVQMGFIFNTGTGGAAGNAYSDYTGQFSTNLSRTSPAMITITSGERAVGHYTAWIDYNQNGQFESSEKLGEFATTTAFESQNISFTVPASATLGTTRLRVRCRNAAGALDPCISYPYGETEDYAVVINGDTPLNCLGLPGGTAWPGMPCDDENPDTGNDVYDASCICAGQWLDCEQVPGGPAIVGTPCNDENDQTGSDIWGPGCVCAGLPYDCAGIAGGTTTVGSPCDDGLASTGNDVYNANCECEGQLIDCLGVIGGSTLPGSPCDDGNPLSGGDVYTAGCLCAGQFTTDCAGVVGGTAQPGTPCNDNNPATGGDVYGVNCVCAGQAYDCAGTAGGTQLPGTPCNDNNPNTTGDTFTADCNCLGVAANDCLGVPGGTAQPGTSCDDGNTDTVNDVYSAFCECVGQVIDCNGVVGGSALPGFPCDDGNTATGGDILDANCQCTGLLIDCTGVPGGGNLPGTTCDDGDPNTSNDAYNVNCICAGTLANDCLGVPGGTAQPGTPCDDGNVNTGNDIYNANCACAGQPLDCNGVVNGFALPGSTCNDGDACTTGDVWDANCNCSGTAVTISAVSGSTMVVGLTTIAYFIDPIAGANNYIWDLPNGWSTSDDNAFVLLADVDNTPGDVELCVTAIVGACEVTSCINVTVDFNTGITTAGANTTEWFTVQPNPSNGQFKLQSSNSSADPIRISLCNGLGQEVIAPFSLAGQRSIDMDLSGVASGAYYVLASRNGKQQAMKIMVQR